MSVMFKCAFSGQGETPTIPEVMTETNDYDYELPAELIAQNPLPTRGDARLLVVRRQEDSTRHAHVRDLPNLLRPGDCLVLNDSKVLAARLVGFRSATGGKWQGLFLNRDKSGAWEILSRTRGRLQPGEWVTLCDRQLRPAVRIQMLVSLGEGRWAARPESADSPINILERVGRVPLPPYIRDGEMVDSDWERYQTVFARDPGSVAAPTAGLHFSQRLFNELQANGIQIQHVTLHVGPGTFRPIATANLEEHSMHSEWGTITEEVAKTINTIRNRGGRVIAVGSTSVRLLESASAGGTLRAWTGETDLFIRPPYPFRLVDGLMTNFHLPRSTLLVMVRTFGGDSLVRAAYREAIEQRYRFYSYGDAMLIL